MQSLKHMPKGAWEFDEDVTACFDDMLERSIPQLDVARNLVTSFAKRYALRGTTILDIGCSTGGMLQKLIETLGEMNYHYLGLDNSPSMVLEAQKRMEKMPKVQIIECDLRKEFPEVWSSVVVSFLTMQFIPIEYRRKIIQQVYDSLTKSGCFLMVEKVTMNGSQLQEDLTSIYHELKQVNGYSLESIQAKQKSLENTMVCLPVDWNKEMLYDAGFREVETFWQWGPFVGFVAIK